MRLTACSPQDFAGKNPSSERAFAEILSLVGIIAAPAAVVAAAAVIEAPVCA